MLAYLQIKQYKIAVQKSHFSGSSSCGTLVHQLPDIEDFLKKITFLKKA